jgi:glycogen(starch) synthase
VILRRFRPDIVNIHFLGLSTLFVWLVHSLIRFRLIVSLHGADVDSEPYKNRFNRWLFHSVLKQANQVTACSDHLLHQALELEPDIQHKVTTIHNGVDVVRFIDAAPYSYPRCYLLGVGRLVKAKGFDLLIAAFAQLAPIWLDVDLLLAGDGPERDALAAQIQTSQLNGRVSLFGAADHRQVPVLMRGSLAIIIPSRREPFGIVGLEALASGRPVVASRVGGLVEALGDADVSWFVNDYLPSLVQALSLVLRREASHGPFNVTGQNEANQARVRGQSWQHVTERYLAIFGASLVQNGNRPS